MQGISSWVAGISAVVLIGAVISSIAPKNGAGKVASMLGSILVIVALLSPLRSFDSEKFIEVGEDVRYKVELEIADAEEKTEKMKKELIQKNLSAYVLNKANARESECEVSVNTESGNVSSARVISENKEAADRIKKVLNDDLQVADVYIEIKKEEA